MAMDPFLEELSKDHLRIVKTQPYPERWRIFCDKYSLAWHSTPFKREHAGNVSDKPGVYCFHIGHDLTCLPTFGVSLYGGITQRSLRERFLEYFRERDSNQGRTHVRKFLMVFREELSFGWSEVDTTPAVDLKTIEKDFNDAMMPPYSIRDFSADVLKKRNAWS